MKDEYWTEHGRERQIQRRFSDAQVAAILAWGEEQEKPGGATAFVVTRKVLERTKGSDVKFRRRDIGAAIVVSDLNGKIITAMRGNTSPGRTPTSARRAVHRNKKSSRKRQRGHKTLH